KSKNAQEAHEAIRPTVVSRDSHEIIGAGLTRDHVRLYDLIWKRFVACQMNEAIMDQTTIDVSADKYLLRATGSVIKFEGWLKLYQVSSSKYQGEEEATEKDENKKEQVLPEL